MKSPAEIRKRIAELEKEFEVVRARAEIRSLSNISPTEKCLAFDDLYRRCRAHIEQVIEEGYPGKDSDHYIYELAMMLTLGDDIFDTYNRFVKYE